MPETGSTSERALAGRIGGYVRASMYDGAEMTAAARRGFNARFDKQVDPDGVLPPAERARRAEAARKAYFAQLAHKSVTARRRKSARRSGVAAPPEPGTAGGDAA